MKRAIDNHRPPRAYPGAPPVRAAVCRPRARLPIGLALFGALVHLMLPRGLPALPAPALAFPLASIPALAMIGRAGSQESACWEMDDLEAEWVAPGSPDTTPPAVAGVYPPPGSTIEQDATFTVQVQDDSPLAFRLVLDGWAVMCQGTMGVDNVAGTITVSFPLEYETADGSVLRYVLWGGDRDVSLEIIDKAGNVTVAGGQYYVDVPILDDALSDLEDARAQVARDVSAEEGEPIMAWLDLFGLFGAEGGFLTHATTHERMVDFVDSWDGWDGTADGKVVFQPEKVVEVRGQVLKMLTDYNPSAPNWPHIKDKPWAPVGLLPPDGATVLIAPGIIIGLIIGIGAIGALICRELCPKEGKSWLCRLGSLSGILLCVGGLMSWARAATTLAGAIGEVATGWQVAAGGALVGSLSNGVIICANCLAAVIGGDCPQCSRPN